jgi:glucosamine--fructose-6-phosphate aminotransferase (isomerizing)
MRRSSKIIDGNIIVARSTSWHARIVGEYLIEEYASIPVEVDYASEFRYKNPFFTDKNLLSQSEGSYLRK